MYCVFFFAIEDTAKPIAKFVPGVVYASPVRGGEVGLWRRPRAQRGSGGRGSADLCSESDSGGDEHACEPDGLDLEADAGEKSLRLTRMVLAPMILTMS